jgi:hypothetical protein
VLNDCLLTHNYATAEAGGAFASTLNRCVLSGNSAYWDGAGATSCTLNNCVLTGGATMFGGGAYNSTLSNCTVVANSGGGVYNGAAYNCIIYYNEGADSGGSHYNCWENSYTNAPGFVDFPGGNLRLQTNSPCVNAGNNSYVTGSLDLDGNLRIAGSTVDIGAYEFQNPASVISYAWLQQYGLPIDGSADYTDNDSDLMNNWQEWRAGTIPTNALSVLQMSKLTNSVSGTTLTWLSVGGVNYFLQGSSLNGGSGFSTLQSNIVGQAETTSFTDTNVVGANTFFYRVGVQ